MNDIAAGIINVPYVQDTHGLNGSGQVIAVADTGLDTGFNDGAMHDDLEGRIDALIDLSGNGAADIFSGHGTHVAGSVLGNGSNSNGQFKGMAPEAHLVFQAVEDQYERLSGIPTHLSSLFQQAYDRNARIHTNSWGSSDHGQYTSYSQDVDLFTWEHPDMLILFSAGNDGVDSNSDGVIDLDSIGSPATAKNCLAIGASENYRPDMSDTYGDRKSFLWATEPIYSDKMADHSEGIAAFSSRGPTDDGRIKPDVVAPGTYIISTRSSVATGQLWGDYDPYYRYSGGTSMSTPIVAGSAALVRQYYVEYENIAPSAALLKATIINGAYDMAPGQYDGVQEIQVHPDAAQGWGRVDIVESLFPTFPRKIYFNDTSSTVSLNTSESWDINYYVGSSSVPLKITLVWTDYPGSINAAVELTNNLDLVVRSPYDTYLGNGGSQPDAINNVEQVELLSPDTGWYTITVNGTNVPQGPQPFAIVMSGVFGNDSIAPSSISDLNALPSETWINWSWTNPSDTDFDHVELYFDGVLKLNSSSTYYNATHLTANTSYELSTRSVDYFGNINSSWINSSVNTTADITAPSSITGLFGTPGETWINWSWTNPSDPDFSHVELYLNGVLKLNSSSTYYNATYLTANTSYELSIRTVDNVGNINGNWINSTVSNDITAPSSITGLGFTSGESWINWSWSNPSDPDFSHVEVYLDDIFKLNTSSTYYNATHLAAI
ncbi:S8 family serine peptidase, partial [Methanococcoides methylutens]